MKDGAFVVIDETGIRTHIPVGSVACIMLEPDTRVSHMAVALAARAGDFVGLGRRGRSTVLCRRTTGRGSIGPLVISGQIGIGR